MLAAEELVLYDLDSVALIDLLERLTGRFEVLWHESLSAKVFDLAELVRDGSIVETVVAGRQSHHRLSVQATDDLASVLLLVPL